MTTPYHHLDVPEETDFDSLELGMEFRFRPNWNARTYRKYTKTLCWDGADKFRLSPKTIVYVDDYTGHYTCDVCACDVDCCECSPATKRLGDCESSCCLSTYLRHESKKVRTLNPKP